MSATTQERVLNDKERVVLARLADEGPMTADAFVTSRGWYINSWAPSFTQLRKGGLVARTGEQRTTSHRSKAHVITITEAGRAALAAL